MELSRGLPGTGPGLIFDPVNARTDRQKDPHKPTSPNKIMSVSGSNRHRGVIDFRKITIGTKKGFVGGAINGRVGLQGKGIEVATQEERARAFALAFKIIVRRLDRKPPFVKKISSGYTCIPGPNVLALWIRHAGGK